MCVKIIGFLVYHSKAEEVFCPLDTIDIGGKLFNYKQLLVDSFIRLNTGESTPKTINFATFFRIPLMRHLFDSYIRAGLLQESLNSRNNDTIKVARTNSKTGKTYDNYKAYKFHSELHVGKWVRLL